MTTELKVLIDCYKCEEPIMTTMLDYLSYIFHRYMLFMDIAFVCEDCS